MIDFGNILILAQKELRDAQRNRWFGLYTIAFAGLSLALAWLALSGTGNYGLAGFGRTSASLINMVLMIVPLMGLTLGALSLGGRTGEWHAALPAGTTHQPDGNAVGQVYWAVSGFAGSIGFGIWPDRRF